MAVRMLIGLIGTALVLAIGGAGVMFPVSSCEERSSRSIVSRLPSASH